MTEQIVFMEKHITLVVGDKLLLLESMTGDDFYRSKLGKLFESKKCDSALLTVKQRPWLEIYFELTLFIDNEPVTYWSLKHAEEGKSIEALELDLSKIDDRATMDYLTAIFTETANYDFLRRFIDDGAIKYTE